MVFLRPHAPDYSIIESAGQVSKVEFMMFILDRLELVGQDEMNRILEMFDEADTAGDGILNLQVQPLLTLQLSGTNLMITGHFGYCSSLRHCALF